MDKNRYIVLAALRIARLAAIDAVPAVVLFNQADILCRRCAELYKGVGGDPEQWRKDRAAIESEIVEPLSAEEIVELEREEKAYDDADTKARLAAGYSEAEWLRLDTSYRFDLILQHMPNEVA